MNVKTASKMCFGFSLRRQVVKGDMRHAQEMQMDVVMV
jgi:hypothetical protein